MSSQLPINARRRARGKPAAAAAASASISTALSMLLALVMFASTFAPNQVDASKLLRSKSTKVAELKLGALCHKIQSIKKISQMQELIESLEFITGEFQQQQQASSKNPLSYLARDSSQPCLAQPAPILDLKELLAETENVCSSEHIDKIEKYHEKHIKTASGGLAGCCSPAANAIIAMTSSSITKPLTARFFSLYASQVSFACKANLLRSLLAIERAGVISKEDFTNALPWLSQASYMNCEHIPFDKNELPTSSAVDGGVQETLGKTGDPLATSQKRKSMSKHCRARSALYELNNIDELALLLDSDDAALAMNKQTEEAIGGRRKAQSGVPSDSDKTEKPDESADSESEVDGAGPRSDFDLPVDEDSNGLVLEVPASRIKMVSDMTHACSKVKPVYDEVVMPIVRLYRIGAAPEFENFNKACAEKPIIKKWFGLTLVCETVLKSRLVKDVDNYKMFIDVDNIQDDGYVIFDQCEDPNIGCEAASRQRNSNEALAIKEQVRAMRRVTLDDELWIYKYETNSIQRFRNSIARKMYKAFNMEDQHGYVHFVRTVTDIKRWIVRGLLTTFFSVAINLA